jgi:hypothetical protein
MSTDQCAQNPDGTLKDANNIQWFFDKDDAQPLPSAAPSPQPLGRGLRNKAANRFFDTVARERLGSDDEDLNGPPRRKRIARTSNVSGGAVPPTTSEILPVEEPSDTEKDQTFQSDGDSKSSDDDTGDNSTDLELISNNEVRLDLFSYAAES